MSPPLRLARRSLLASALFAFWLAPKQSHATDVEARYFSLRLASDQGVTPLSARFRLTVAGAPERSYPLSSITSMRLVRRGDSGFDDMVLFTFGVSPRRDGIAPLGVGRAALRDVAITIVAEPGYHDESIRLASRSLLWKPDGAVDVDAFARLVDAMAALSDLPGAVKAMPLRQARGAACGDTLPLQSPIAVWRAPQFWYGTSATPRGAALFLLERRWP
jgi:hypothetical protein